MTIADSRVASPASPAAPSARPSPVRLLLTALAFAILGIGLGLVVGTVAKKTGRDLLGVDHVALPEVLVTVFFGLWTVLLVHELGHLLAGLMQGNRLMLFAAGPLLVRREDGHVRVRFNRSMGLWGGVAATLPRGAALAALRDNLFRVVLWGPLASLLLTAVAVALLPATSGMMRLYAAMTAVGSFAIFLATTLPPRTGNFYTDGARLRMLHAGGDDAERWCTVSALAAMTTEGRPAAEWDTTLVVRAGQLADGSLDGIMLRLMLFEHALGIEDMTAAAAQMAAVRPARDALSPMLRSHLALESAYWAAVGEHDAGRARAELDQASESPFVSKVTRLRTEGAVLMIEGETSRGRVKLDDADALIAAAPHDSTMRSERTRIERARRIS